MVVLLVYYIVIYTLHSVFIQGLLNLFEDVENNPNNRKFRRILEDLFDGLDVINEILKLEPLFITKTAEELQWGYEDPIFKLVHAIDPSLLPSATFSLRVSIETSVFFNYKARYLNCLLTFIIQQKVHIQSPIVIYTGKYESSAVYVLYMCIKCTTECLILNRQLIDGTQ